MINNGLIKSIRGVLKNMTNITKTANRTDLLATYWKSLNKKQKQEIACNCDSSTDYLRKVFCYPWRQPGSELAKNLSNQTGINRAKFRPDLWEEAGEQN